MIVRFRKERGRAGTLPVGTTREIATAAWDEKSAKAEARKALGRGLPGENLLDWESSIFDPADEARYRVVDEHPYLDREEEWDALTLAEAVGRMEDLTEWRADELLAQIDEEGDDTFPLEYVDDETGRSVTMTKAIS